MKINECLSFRMHILKAGLLFTFLFGICQSLSAGLVEANFYYNRPDFSRQGDFSLLWMQGLQNTGKAGEPELPYQAVSLLLPPGEKAVKIKISREFPVVMEGNFLIFPHQPAHPLSDTGSHAMIINESIYESDRVCPLQPEGRLSTYFLSGFAFALCSFTPVDYFPHSGRVVWYGRVKVTITTEPDPAASAALGMLNSRPGLINRLSRFAQNPEMIDNYPLSNLDTSDYEILLLCPEAFSGSFQQLVQTYLIRGSHTQVVTLPWVYNNSTGNDNPEKIRNFIISEYLDHHIEQVILAGDAELLPYRGFYCQVQSSSIYTDNNIPSDLYYSALDGNWNTDGDNLWGEIGEDDLLPEVSVGRLTVSTQEELDNLLNKIILYQNNPVISELDKPFLVGEKLYDNPLTWGGNYMDLLIDYQDTNGYETTGIPATQDIEKLYDRDLPLPWTATTFINKVNSGKSILFHVGHANTNYVMRLVNSDITTSNFQQMNGLVHNFIPLYSHGCYCGAFDAADCIAEKMLTIPEFANAFVGNSRYGWFNEGTTEGPSQHLNREFVNALYSEKISQIGSAHLVSKVATAPWVNAPGQWEEGALRWCFYCCNVLGDPAMNVWTDLPISLEVIHPSSVVNTTLHIPVDVYQNNLAAPGLTCTLLKGSTIMGVGTTDLFGHCLIEPTSLPMDTGNALIVVSGYNCLPDTHLLVIISTPDCFAEAGKDTTVCAGSCVSLSGSGNGSYLWSTGDTTASLLVCPDTTTWYYLTVSSDSCNWTDSVRVTLTPVPDFNLGNDTLFPAGQNLLLEAGPGFANYLWSTGSTSQIISVTEAGVYWVQVTNDFGCTLTDTICLFPGSVISGKVVYCNNDQTPMAASSVTIYKDNNLIAVCTSSDSGEFIFPGQLPGNYYLISGTSHPWGGGNSTDALLIMRHFAMVIILEGMPLIAADVDGNSVVNANDALVVQRRFVGLINGFPQADWIFEDKQVILDGWNNDTVLIKAICRGDVNTSFHP